ncbi:MAG: DM13 domain-containing protein [Pseudomonadota bacterium]
MRNTLIAFGAAISFGFATFAALAPAAAMDAQAQADAQTQVLYSGDWTKKSHRASGTWSIHTDGEQTYITLSDDFKTRSAPDLKLFLSPRTASATNGGNATAGSVLIAPLADNRGGQTYLIPAGVDLADYKSVLIHCQQFSKLWSAGSLV